MKKPILFFILLMISISCQEKTVEIQKKAATQTADSTLKWVDYRVGELLPPSAYFAFDSIVKKWGLNYERINGGCEVIEEEKIRYEKNNPKYFAFLKKKFGENWREKFDAEVAALDQKMGKESFSEAPINPPATGKKWVECEDKGGNLEIGFTTECDWFNYTFEETYLAFKEKNKDNDDGKFLEKKMPKSNYTATFKEYPLSVDYQYPKENELQIEILFPGGVTYITFQKEDQGVKVTAVHSPD